MLASCGVKENPTSGSLLMKSVKIIALQFSVIEGA